MAENASSELNLRELRILNALLHECSITRTAQLLSTTQPGISKVLRHLRTQFADPLFVRNGHAMQPTARALEIADQLRALLGAADSLRAAVKAFDPARSDRTFSLLLTDVGMIRFLPPLITHVAAIAPKVNIRAMPLDSRQFELKLEAGEADLALGAFPDAPSHLRRQRLFFDGYVTVARNGHPRFSALRSRNGFLAERHIVISASEAGHAAHRTAHRVLTSQISTANIMLQVPSFIAGAIVAAETDGLATLPANLAKRLAQPLGLIAFETPVALPRIEISQYWHERYHRDAAHRWLRSATSYLFGATAQKRGATDRARSPPPRTIPR
jgi:DNA-binding transcriptional LysR family regulator